MAQVLWNTQSLFTRNDIIKIDISNSSIIKKNDPLNFNIEVFNHKEWIFLSRTIRNKLEKLEKLEKLVPKNIQKPEKYK